MASAEECPATARHPSGKRTCTRVDRARRLVFTPPSLRSTSSTPRTTAVLSYTSTTKSRKLRRVTWLFPLAYAARKSSRVLTFASLYRARELLLEANDVHLGLGGRGTPILCAADSSRKHQRARKKRKARPHRHASQL